MSWNNHNPGYATVRQPPTPTATPTSATAPTFAAPHYPIDGQNWQFKQEQQNMHHPAVNRLSSETSRKRQSLNQDDLNAELASHIHMFNNNSLPLPPVHPSRQLSSSPLKRNRLSQIHGATPVRTDGRSFEQTQTQTPPPTSTGRSLRRVSMQKRDSVISVGSAVGAETPVRSADVHNEYVGESPEQLQHPFSSSDIFAYPMSAPATYPQRYLWDTSPTMTQDQRAPTSNPVQQSPGFFADMTPQMNKFVSSPPPMFLFGTATRPAEYNATLSSSHEASDPFVFSDAFHGSDNQRTPTSAHGFGGSVDPNLIFKFPIPSSPPVSDLHDNGPFPRRRPVSAAFGETLRQKELETLRNPKPRAQLSRTNSRSSVQSVNTLKRNSMVGKATAAAASASDVRLKQNQQRPLSRVGSLHGEKPLHRSSSLSSLRRGGSTRTPSLASSVLRTRTVVSLKVDATGRARTETQEVTDEEEDTISRGSMDDESSETWDYLDSDSSDDDDIFHEGGSRFIPSRRSSLAIPRLPQPPTSTPLKETCISPSVLSSVGGHNSFNFSLPTSGHGQGSGGQLAPAFNLTSSPPVPMRGSSPVRSPSQELPLPPLSLGLQSGDPDESDAGAALKRIMEKRMILQGR